MKSDFRLAIDAITQRLQNKTGQGESLEGVNIDSTGRIGNPPSVQVGLNLVNEEVKNPTMLPAEITLIVQSKSSNDASIALEGALETALTCIEELAGMFNKINYVAEGRVIDSVTNKQYTNATTVVVGLKTYIARR